MNIFRRMVNYRALLLAKKIQSNRHKEPVRLKSPAVSKTIDEIKLAYYQKVWEISEAQDLHLLTDYDKRRSTHALDHIIPISYGYKNSIPSEVIGNIKNLRFISFKENLTKSARITNMVIDKLEEFGVLKQVMIEVI